MAEKILSERFADPVWVDGENIRLPLPIFHLHVSASPIAKSHTECGIQTESKGYLLPIRHVVRFAEPCVLCFPKEGDVL